MEHKSERAARLRHLLTFAALIFQYANLAYATAPDITFTPATLDFQYQAGAALPASQTFQIKSTGAALSFTLSITGPLPYSAQWLVLSANAGTTNTSIKVYVNPTGLPSGSYSGTITVTTPSPPANAATYSFPVTLEVADAPSTLIASATTLTFAFVTGGTAPASQAIVLLSSGDALSATITVSGGTWLKASPTGSIALVGLPRTITVTADPTGLPPGSYTGKITFAAPMATNKSLVVNVTLTITAGVPTINIGGVWPPGVLVNSAAAIVTLTGTNYFPTSVASIGGTALTTTVLSSNAMLVTIPATMLTTAGPLGIVITTPTALSPSMPATFTVYSPGPQIWAVADSASYATSNVSPGEIITIFGIGLGPTALTLYPAGTSLPASLPATGTATSVAINGLPAPLLYTSASQVSCIVPYAVAAQVGNPVNVVLTYSTASPPVSVNVVATDPGVFSMDASGAGQGAILNYNTTTLDYTVNSSSAAAPRGSTVVLYATGFGQVVDASQNGGNENNFITTAQAPVTPVATVTITIGGQAATVQTAVEPVGSVPGVLQVTATVLSGVTVGNAVPVVLTAGGVASQARVTMAVK